MKLSGMKQIDSFDSARLLKQFVDEIDLNTLYSTYFRIRENQISPMNMLKIMLYAYMNRLYSCSEKFLDETSNSLYEIGEVLGKTIFIENFMSKKIKRNKIRSWMWQKKN